MSEAMEEPLRSNRPENTKFKQQKLDAWQPILTPGWVIGTFVLVGIVFVPVGAYLWKLSDNLFESIVTYDSGNTDELTAGISSYCRIDQVNEGFARLLEDPLGYENCTITFEFDRDVNEDNTVYMYYQISNFYQNHRRYVQSVSSSQLLDDVTINDVFSRSSSSLSSDCEPEQSFQNISFPGDRIFFPCGLIALSVFNDGIELQSFERPRVGNSSYAAGVLESGDPDLEVDVDRSGIAWSSDLQNNYRNPTATDCLENPLNPRGNFCPTRYFQYQYLWQTYDQFLCYAPVSPGSQVPDLTNPQPCIDYTELVNSIGEQTYGAPEWNSFADSSDQYEFFGNGCAACADGDLLVNAGGILPPLDNQSATSMGGVRDEGFIVWMRTAGLPTFRKLYGELKPPQGGFKKGDRVSFSVVPNFLVSTIEGSKSLVLGTTSPLGGKNDILGIAYMTVGSICLFLALLFAIKQKINPRRLGDPSYLAFGKRS